MDGFAALDHLVRVLAAARLERTGLIGAAETLRHLPPLVDLDTTAKSADTLREIQLQAYRAAGLTSWAGVPAEVFAAAEDVLGLRQASWTAVSGGHTSDGHRLIQQVAGYAYTTCIYAEAKIAVEVG